MAAPVTFIDCTYNDDREYLTMASSFDELEDEEETFLSQMTVLSLKTGYAQLRLDGIRARSVASNGRFTWVIGEQGEIWTYPRGVLTPAEEVLPDSGVRSDRHLGRPERIRLIAGIPYVCGYAGQVYTLSDGRWVHMDDGIVEPEGKVDSVALEGIHGTGAKDIYVVGSGGTLAHWNGRTWTRIPLLTTVNLADVRAISKKHVVAVGDDGVFIEWDGTNWTVAQIPGYEETVLADVEVFKDKMYVAAVGQLLVRNTSGWSVVETGADDDPEFIRLAAGGGRLWAMGAKRVHSFDGKTWATHIDPDNG